jgi:chorismate mutase/prephenate dehydrogenase
MKEVQTVQNPNAPLPDGRIRGENLEDLRTTIRDIDRKIADLVAKRMDVVAEVARAKNEMRLPIRDFRVEHEVMGRMESRCRELGVDPMLGRLLARLLIQSAVRVQEGIVERVHTGSLMKVLILGGSGRMGRWFCNYLDSMGHQVSVYDPQGPVEGFGYTEDLGDAVRTSEMILLSTPLSASGDILGEVMSTKPGGIVFDICSLKSHLVGHARAAARAGLSITSLHPMFGPGVRTLLERNVILCRCGSPDADREVKALFEGTEANLIEMDIEEHDELMAYVLSMSHVVNLVFTDMLVRSGKSFPDLSRVASSTFVKQTKASRDVAYEAAELYYEIQTLNTHTNGAFSLFLEAAKDLERAVRERDFDRFAEIMQRGRSYYENRG